MAKVTKIFRCSECSATFPKWQGQCTTCKEWNTLEEVAATASPSAVATHVARSGYAGAATGVSVEPVRLSDVKSSAYQRISTGFSEFDRLMGGGVVTASVNFLSGEPGAGKSTLLLQLCDHTSRHRSL